MNASLAYRNALLARKLVIIAGIMGCFGLALVPFYRQICEATGIDESTRVRDLTEADVNKLRAWIDQNLTVEGDLRRDVAQDIKRKMEINCLQGIRHRKGLPVRGQRTRTNARTRKGPKRTVAGKKKVKK